MKYASLPEADCHVLDTVKVGMAALGSQFQLHATPSVMLGFIVFRRSSNTTPGLAPTSLGSRDMDDGTWYIDPDLSVGMTSSY